MILEEPQDGVFIPESIDGQIEHLTQEEREETSEFRLVRDLQIAHREESEEERAFERIRERLIMYAAGELPQGVQEQKQPIRDNRSPKQERGFQTSASTKLPPNHAWTRQMTMLAAVLIATLMVGSLVVVLQMAHSGIVTTAPSKRLPPIAKASSGIYLHLDNPDSNSQIVKIDIQTNKVMWRFTVKPDFSSVPGSYSSSFINIIPVVGDGNVYFTEAPDRLYALNAQTGELRWERHFQMELGKPYVVNDIVYINTYNPNGDNTINGLYALNATNGMTKIKYKSTGDILDIIDDVMYLKSGNTLTAIRVTDGRQLWQTKTEALQSFSGDIYARNGFLYISSFYTNNKQLSEDHSYVYTINIQSGKIIWQSPKINGDVYNIVISDKGQVYCSVDNYYIYAFDPKTNRQLWKYHTKFFFPEMVTQGDVVYVKQAHNNFLTALNATTGIPGWIKPLQRGDTYYGPMRLYNGLIYVNTTNGLEGFSTSTGNRVVIIPSETLLGKNAGKYEFIVITIS